MMRRHLLYGSYSDKSSDVLQTSANLMWDRIRNVLVIVLILGIVAMAVYAGRAVSYQSDARELFVKAMQTEMTEALSLSSSLSRTAGANSNTTLGRIRACVHAMDTINEIHGNLEGGGRYYVPVETFSSLSTILDNYSSRLLTGLNTGDMQGELQDALEQLQTMVSGL